MRKPNRNGQALMEWVILCGLFSLLFVATFTFIQWFVIRQQLLRVVKEGALLYSSGRVIPAEVKHMMIRSLQLGHPSLSVPRGAIYVGPSRQGQATLYSLDQVSIRYQPPTVLAQVLNKEMTESCTIKHAPSYQTIAMIPLKPPVPWGAQ